MGRKGITYQDVEGAINSIIADGDSPTIKKIIAVLGTGSPNTVHRHLKAWRATAPAKEYKVLELPAGLQSALVKEFERQAAEVRVEFESRLIEIQTEATELAETGELLEAEMAEIQKRNQSLSDECQRLKALADERSKEIDRLKIELAGERERAEDAKTKAAVCEAKLESSTKRTERLEKALADQKTDFEKRLAEQMTEARRREQVFEKQLKETRTEYQQRINELKGEQTQERAGFEPVKALQDFDFDTQEQKFKADINASKYRYVQNLADSGLSLTEIANKLNDEGYPTLKGKTRWTHQIVGSILKKQKF